MQSSIWKKIGFFLVILLLLLGVQESNIAEAATPSFEEDDIEISGTGEVYQLGIIDKKANSTYKWTSSDKSVAKVSKNGLITTLDKGTTKIKCKIVYASGKTKTLTCKVTVTIPATGIRINNAMEKNGAHIMRVGETYNFNRSLTPKNSSDKTYWSLDTSNDEANPNAVRIDNSSNGTVTALRRGKVVLVATAAKESTADSAAESYVNDAIIIEVVGASAEVVSAEIVNSQKIKVVFGTTIKASTLVDTNGYLTNNISLSRLEDTVGDLAKDPGTLKASLSASMKVLTITAANTFDGRYGITFSDGILTTEGKAIYKDYLEVNYAGTDSSTDMDTDTADNTDYDNSEIDSSSPRVVSTVLDDDGMTTIITFTEKMDFTKLSVINAQLTSGSSTALSSTLSFLNAESNYTFSTDSKSMRINLSGISSQDYNKAFRVTISGIADTSGNQLENGSADIVVRTDTSQKVQARPISVVRTGYNTLTATFSRSIKTPGYLNVYNGGYYPGEVDSDNNKKVNYTIWDGDALLTGSQKVSIGFWDSYNVLDSDTYADTMREFTVYFVTDKIRPVLVSYNYNSDLGILTLTYSEKVKLLTESGTLYYIMSSSQREDSTGYLTYTQTSATDNVIEITLNNITIYGEYTFTLDEGFALDSYRNMSYSKAIKIYKVNGEGSINQLAEPYSVYQSDVNHSFVYIEFADKLDVTSALDIDNYNLSGAAIEEVKLISNSSEGATIRLSLKKGLISSSGEYRITISGLKGYNGASTEMAQYSTQVKLIENTDPVLKSVKYNSTEKNQIVLTFSEKVKGTMMVTVQKRTTGEIIGNTVSASGNTVTITLDSIPDDGTYLKIYVQDNSITDLNGNESTVSPVLNVFVNY